MPGAPCLFFLGFGDLSRFHHRTIPFCWQKLGRSRAFSTDAKFTIIQTDSIAFQTHFRFDSVCLCFRLWDSQHSHFKNVHIFRIIQDYTVAKFSLLGIPREKPIVSDPRKTQTFSTQSQYFSKTDLI